MFKSKTSVEKILKVQEKILDRLSAIEKRLAKIEANQGEVKTGIKDSITSLMILYGKMVLTRLNLVELSEGRKVSVSENEQKEIDNALGKRNDPKVFPLPKIKITKRRKHTLN